MILAIILFTIGYLVGRFFEHYKIVLGRSIKSILYEKNYMEYGFNCFKSKNIDWIKEWAKEDWQKNEGR